MGKKKKSVSADGDSEWTPKKAKITKTGSTSKICIIHTPTSCSSASHFTKINENSIKRLLDIRDERQRQPVSSPQRMDGICKLLMEHVNSRNQHSQQLGYHPSCYKHFARHAKRLTDEQPETKDENGASGPVSNLYHRTEHQITFCSNLIAFSVMRKVQNAIAREEM